MWRSLLYVPAHVERFVAKAHTRGADAIQLDLEDSVPLAQKAAARAGLQEAAALVARGGADVIVRVNRPWRLCLLDLEAAVGPGIKALALPKVEGAQHVQLISEVVAELEAERGMAVGSTLLIPMIESASGFFRAQEIASASSRVVALTLGAEDFALSAGMLPEAEGLLYPKLQVMLAARAAGVTPLGFIGTVADYKNLDAFRAAVRRSRRLGFEGASCIHPDQVGILNEEFTASETEVAQARRVVAAYEAAVAAGLGAVELDGRMVDVPVVERARQVLVRRERYGRSR